MNILQSIIMDTDSYKFSQWTQYPPNTSAVFSYIESRGGKWDETVFFGAQGLMKKWAENPITQEEIDIAEKLVLAHGEPFNREGWEYIVKELDGKLPVRVRAVPEGTVIEGKNVLLTIENTDPKCFWLTSYLETSLLRSVWYGTTVATNSFHSKKIIMKYLEHTGTPEDIGFKLHDFGSRGVSSLESAMLGGAAHLVNFMGTDTFMALPYIMENYGMNDVVGFSIPASEHSTITSWGRENEVKAYENMIKQFGKDGAIFACVSDSYDIYKACEMWGTTLKDQVVNSGATLVVRPDSGTPSLVVSKCLDILEKHFGATTNEKGYKVLNNVRVIQGDGIDGNEIECILAVATGLGYSADNIAFGQGGGLLQQIDRDTLKFAMKCSAAHVDGKWIDVYKDPITDSGKRSKRGRVDLIKDSAGKFVSTVEDWPQSALVTIFEDGKQVEVYTFDCVRARANQPFQA